MEEEGYRSWQIVDPTTNPRLAAMCKAFVWTSKDVMEGNIPDFNNKAGFYSYSDPLEVVKSGNYPRNDIPSAMGKISLLGDTVHGSRATRTNRARVDYIFDDSDAEFTRCDICNKPGGYLTASLGSNSSVNLCEACSKRIEKALGSKSADIKKTPRSEILTNLSEHYDVPLVKMTASLRQALRDTKR